MASNETKSSHRDPDHFTEAQNAASSNAQEHALLKALQELIVPLRHQTVNNKDMNQILLGPEAGKLITALRDFVSSAVRSQEGKNGIQVSLSEGDGIPEAPLTRDQVDLDYDIDGEEKRQPISEEQVSRELREHVFNKMPIRLLSFERLGPSDLHITLVERESVYARIQGTMRSQMHKAELYPQLYTDKYNRIKKETHEMITERLMSKYARYAILSHTWLRTAPGEVTYGDWNKGGLDANAAGYQKLVNFCKTAWREHGVTFGWMDTVCINKDSSSELDESIRSMYNWYQRASVCIVYLADTEKLSKMHSDRWFTRGWTLQELLAPRVIKFYNNDWKRLVELKSGNDKDDKHITDQIKHATTITAGELDNTYNVYISRRMQLAAKRQVTREEDTAYSLMGIFGVSIATAYGEGAERAFSRLLQEILTTYQNVMDIFNWASTSTYQTLPPHCSNILPASPQNYIFRSAIASTKTKSTMRPIEPLTLTHLGLRVPVILMPSRMTHGPAIEYHPIGDYRATVDISPVWRPDFRGTYYLLEDQISGPDGKRENGKHAQSQITFAVVNFTRITASTIRMSKTCLAMALQCLEPAGKVSNSSSIVVIQTDSPIVISLEKRTTVTCKIDSDDFGDYWRVEIDELSKHGMQLVTLYL